MKIFFKKIPSLGLPVLLFFFLIPKAEAAKLFFLPATSQSGVGQEFEIQLNVDSEGKAFNAAEATIQFNKDVLEVKSLDYSPDSSIFNFWLENPNFSNAEGKISFVGGATNGVSGGAIPILKIRLLAKGDGQGTLTFSDAAITASDGSGTNILSTMEIATIKVVPSVGVPPAATSTAAAPGATSALTPVLPAPLQVVRTPVSLGNLPARPTLSVSQYPDQKKWYNAVSPFTARWNLPIDVLGVSTAVNDIPDFSPDAKSEGLFDSKVFPSLSSGIHYLHVRFKNSVGWGSPTHYRIAIDTLPPLPFKIETATQLKTISPSPTISFSTSDGLSGIEYYGISIDNGQEVTTLANSLTLPVLGPGRHHITVRAVDNAGNSLEDGVDIEIAPLPSPSIIFVTKDVSFGELIYASGKTQPGLSVQVRLSDQNNREVLNERATVDASGNWQMLINNPLSTGQYTLTATAVNGSGAASYPTPAQTIMVRQKPVVSVGSFELGWLEIMLIFILTVGAVGGSVFWRLYSLQEKRGAYRTVVERDISKLTAMLENDLEFLKRLQNSSVSDQSVHAATAMRIAKMSEIIDNMKKYFPQELEKM